MNIIKILCICWISKLPFLFGVNIHLSVLIVDKLTGKRPLGRPRLRWEDNIRMDLKEIGINTRNWVDSAKDRDYWKALVNAALNLRVP